MQTSPSKFPDLEDYKIIEELEKTSIYSIYQAINNSTKKIHLVKIFNIPKNKFNQAQSWVQLIGQLLFYLKELPDDIAYDSISQIEDPYQIVLTYHPKITDLNSLKYYQKSNSFNESLTPEQAFYSFVLILENYKAILKRTREPFSLQLDNILLFRDNLTIDYVSNQIIDIINDDNNKSLMGEDQFKKCLGMLLYNILYQDQEQPLSDNCQNSKSSSLHLTRYNDKYNKYGLNNAIKILLKNDGQNLFDAISSILSALKIEGKNHNVIKHLQPIQQSKLNYIWGISDKLFLQKQSLEEFQNYLLNSIYYDNFDLFTDLVQVFNTTSYYNEINGVDIIYQAAQQNNIEAFIILSKQFNIPIEEYNKISLIVSQLGYLEIVKYLIQEIKVDINYHNAQDMTILLLSAYTGHLQVVKYLIEDIKIDPNQVNDDGNTPLFLSAKQGHLDIVKYLIEDIKIDPNQTNILFGTPLLVSAEQGHLDVVKYLLGDIKIDPNQTQSWGNTPLLLSAQQGHLQVVKYLIEDIKIDHNQTNKLGDSPLLLSAQYGHLQVVKYLIEDIKINPNQPKNPGNTPLMLSAKQGFLQVVKYLIEDIKIDPNQSDRWGNTSLLLSADEGHLQVVKYLIEDIKIDPNQTNVNGSSPLLISAQSRKQEISKYLIKRTDINLNHADNYGNLFWNILKDDSPQILRIIIEDKQVFDELELNFNEFLHFCRSKSFFRVLDILESI